MEMMLDKKQIQVVFLLESKMVHKAAETTCNINNAFDPRTDNEYTLHLEDEECSGRPLEIDNDQLRVIIKADRLATMQEVVEELNVDYSTVTWYLKQIGKLTANKKYRNFEVSASLTLCNNEPFLNQIVTCDKKWILYDN
ncbi:hypothetical protein FD755_015873 [Muntiacus reevesi]|uniref:Uncharacterized protein n=1 Tax=Muntiacus reevesi TaxID=9886 RepID=A0A5N3XDN7_MUNRE|nr:hypothetical protein FD755_015873 [Muntiacus reevesi]